MPSPRDGAMALMEGSCILDDHAGTADDAIFGRCGDDTLGGGEGSDMLEGGEGQNVLHGGPGLDTPELADEGEGAPGWESTGNWTTGDTGFNGGQQVQDGTSGTATWSFTGLASGPCDVYVTWGAEEEATASAPFDWREDQEGHDWQTCTPVDQSVLPTDAWEAGCGWKHLGRFSLEHEGSTLLVRLSAAAQGKSLADAVRIVPRGTAAPQVDISLTGFTAGAQSSTPTVQYTVSASGATPFCIAVFARIEGVTEDPLVGMVSVGEGDCTSGGHEIAVPVDFVKQRSEVQLYAIVDASQVVAETNESNNRLDYQDPLFETVDGTVYVRGSEDADLVGVLGSSVSVQIGQGDAVEYAIDDPTGFVAWLRGGGDSLDGTGLAQPFWVFAGGGDDAVFGGEGDDEIYGAAGADILYGCGGNDWIEGGDDVDEIYGGDGEDWIHGDAGGDTIYGDGGDDYLYGGDGQDTDTSNDTLYGGDGDDHLYGEPGSDALYAGYGRDVLRGGTSFDYLDDGPDMDDAEINDGFNSYWPTRSGLAEQAAHAGSYAYNDNTVPLDYHQWNFGEGGLLDEKLAYDVYARCDPPEPTPPAGQWASQFHYLVTRIPAGTSTEQVVAAVWRTIGPGASECPYFDEYRWVHLYTFAAGDVQPGDTIRVKVTREVPTGEEDRYVFADVAMLRPVLPEVDIDTDSNNDGEITDQDEPVEMDCKIVNANTEELVEVKLRAFLDPAVYTVGNYSVVLRATSGEGNIEVYDSNQSTRLNESPGIQLAHWALPQYGLFLRSVWIKGKYTAGEAVLDLVLRTPGQQDMAVDQIKVELYNMPQVYVTVSDKVAQGLTLNTANISFLRTGDVSKSLAVRYVLDGYATAADYTTRSTVSFNLPDAFRLENVVGALNTLRRGIVTFPAGADRINVSIAAHNFGRCDKTLEVQLVPPLFFENRYKVVAQYESVAVRIKRDPIVAPPTVTVRGHVTYQGPQTIARGPDGFPLANAVTLTDLPLRGAKVEIWDDNGPFEAVLLDTVWTDEQGNYRCVVAQPDTYGAQNGGVDVFIKVIPESRDADEIGVSYNVYRGYSNPDKPVTYYRVADGPHDDRQPGTTDVHDVRIADYSPPAHARPNPAQSDASDDDVFTVFDAIHTFAAYHASLPRVWSYPRESRNLDVEVCDRRLNDRGGERSPETWGGESVHIPVTWRFVWDSIGHEYGHFAYALMGNTSPGGGHWNFANVRDGRGKQDGLSVALEEGWATYFSQIAQKQSPLSPTGVGGYADLWRSDITNVSLIDAPPWANWEDNVEDKAFHYFDRSVHTLIYQGLGEDNEVSVFRTLWDLADGVDIADGDPIGDINEVGVWTAITDSRLQAASYLDTLWKVLTHDNNVGGRRLLDLGACFAENNVVPSPTGMYFNGALQTTLTPDSPNSTVFKFPAPFGVAVATNPQRDDIRDVRLFNRIELAFFTDDGTPIVVPGNLSVNVPDHPSGQWPFNPPELLSVTLEPTTQLKAIQDATYGKGHPLVRWTIKAMDETAPTTGFYFSRELTFTFVNPLMLQASLGDEPSPSSVPTVTADDLAPAVKAAARRWEDAGRHLGTIVVQIADLPAGYLGMQVGNAIYVDRDAGGLGWFVDPTPLEDSEFAHGTARRASSVAPDMPAAEYVDLLTVVMHEMGHVLGLQDLVAGSADDLMTQSLPVGMRRLADSRTGSENPKLARSRDASVSARDAALSEGLFGEPHRWPASGRNRPRSQDADSLMPITEELPWLAELEPHCRLTTGSRLTAVKRAMAVDR